jgi:hypothetical protein
MKVEYMSHNVFRVSGVDRNDGAKMAFVWARSDKQEDLVLVASGYTVVAEGFIPPGIEAGQFTVPFLLPPDCDGDTIVVTGDRNRTRILPNVTVERC